MTLAQFNPKLIDIEKKPIAVLCLFLIGIVVTVIPYLVYENKIEMARNASAERTLQLSIDSMNREQILLYREMALGKKENEKLKTVIVETDSILRLKTEKPVIRILKNR